MSKKAYKNQKKKMSMGLQVACIVLALVLIAAATLTILQFCTPYKPSDWFKKVDEADKPVANLGAYEELQGRDNVIGAVEEAVNAGSSLVLTQFRDGNEIGVFTSARMSKEALIEKYGVSETADSGLQLKISNIKPEYASDKTVTWSVVRNPSETGATNIVPTNYITVHPSTDTLSAVVVCEDISPIQLDIVATFNSNPDLKLTCTCDFLSDYGEVYFGLLDQSMNPARDTREVEFRNLNVKTYEPVIYNMSGSGQYLLQESRVGTIDCTHKVSDTYTICISGTAASGASLVPAVVSAGQLLIKTYQSNELFTANENAFFGLFANLTETQKSGVCDWVTKINANANQYPYSQVVGKILSVSFSIAYNYEYGGRVYNVKKEYTNEIGCLVNISITSADISQGGVVIQG